MGHSSGLAVPRLALAAADWAKEGEAQELAWAVEASVSAEVLLVLGLVAEDSAAQASA